MMKNILMIASLLLFINCGLPEIKQPKIYIADTPDTNLKKDTVTITDSITNGDYIIFGRYCGQCAGHCATMYKLDVAGNILYIDRTDSFWKYKFEDRKSMSFSEIVTDSATIALAKKLNNNLPAFVLSEKTHERIGCPDCTDGCGIYIETNRNNIVKKRDIDYQTSALSADVKKNVDYIKSIIDAL